MAVSAKRLSIDTRVETLLAGLDTRMDAASRLGNVSNGAFGIYREVIGLVRDDTEEAFSLALRTLGDISKPHETVDLIDEIRRLRELMFPIELRPRVENIFIEIGRIELGRGAEVREHLDAITESLELGGDGRVFDATHRAKSIGEVRLAQELGVLMDLRFALRDPPKSTGPE